MDLQMYTDIGLNCILLLTVFRVFNLYISSLTMRGAFPIEGNSSLCAEGRTCTSRTVVQCIDKCPRSSDNTREPSSTRITHIHSKCV